MRTLRTATVLVWVLLLVIAGTTGPALASMPADSLGPTDTQSVPRNTPDDETSPTANRTLIVDGETDEDDDFATIQDAIDNASDGDRIEVRPGIYREQLLLNKNVTLIAPQGATLNGSAFGDDADGIAIIPSRAGSPDIGSGSPAAPVIVGFTITGYERGVNARFSTGNWTLRNVTFHHLGYGVDAQLATGSFQITQVTAYNTTEDAISLQFTSGDWRLDNTTVHGDTLAAISTTSSTGNYTIRDSVIRDVPLGIDAAATEGNWRIENVTLQNHDAPGIDATESSGDWVVRDTAIQNVSAEGIDALRATGDWSVTHTTINSTNDGLVAENTSGDWRITQTTINQADRGVNAGRSKGDWEITHTTIRDTRVWLISARKAQGAWEVHHSALVDNEEDGIDAIDSALEGNATRNWWGTASGPTADDCVGNVDCSDPLTRPPTGALPNVTATRSLGSTTIAAGGSTTVTLTVEVTQAVERLSIAESFSPAVSTAGVNTVQINGNTVIPTTATFQNDTGVVVLENLNAGDTVTATYTVSVADSATIGDTIDISGNVTSGDQTDVPLSTDTLTVAEGSPLDPPVAQYDTDNDGEITIVELGGAASDYASGEIGITELGQVASVYASS